MRILVTGERDFHYKTVVYDALNKVHRKRGITLVLHHNDGGAAFLAADWAQENSIDVYVCNALPKDGKPDAAIAFGNCEKPAGVPVWEIRP